MLSKEEHMVIQLLILASVWRRNLNKMGLGGPFYPLGAGCWVGSDNERDMLIYAKKKRVT